MTYHDLNRLTAHLEQLSGLKLTATQLATLKELASSLSANSEAIQLPASYLAKRIGRTPKTTETALRALISLDLVEATQPRPHHARTYKLASWISCPETCQKLKAHNSPARLKRLNLTSNSYPQETAITSKKSSITSNDYRTNRDIDIDDIELQFLRIIETITELLMEAGELTKDQAKLHSYLISNPEAITAKVKQLANHYEIKGKNLKAWLKAIMETNPRKLFSDLEKTATSSRQALKDKKQPATIYSNTAGSSRVSETRLKKYCQEVIGFTLTATSSSYLLKRGTAITWQDLQLAKQLEQIADNLDYLNPGNRLKLELIDNKLQLGFNDPDSQSFKLDLDLIETWRILNADELASHLEAERLESELRESYNQRGISWHTAESYGTELAEIRERYPRITPAEAGKRYAQAISEVLVKFYQATPETPAQPELYPDLNSWITSNYTQEADYLELMEHYPENNSPNAWDEKAGFNKYQEALDNGYTWEQLVSYMDYYRENLGTSWPKTPAKWLNDLLDKRKLKQENLETRAGEALDIASILDSLNPANKAL